MLSTLPELAQWTREGALVYHHGCEAETYKVRLAKGTELQIPISTKRIPPHPGSGGRAGGRLQTLECRWNGNLSSCTWVPSLGS